MITLNGVSRQAVDIKNGISAYIPEESGILFKFDGIKNPSSSMATSSFAFFTFDSINDGIDQLTTGLTVQASVGALTSVKVFPSDVTGVLQYAKVYTVQFISGDLLDSNSGIVVTLPSASFTVT